MAKKISNKKDDSMEKKLLDLGLGLAGGLAANFGSNMLEKQTFMQGKEEFVPLIPMGLGALGYIFLPKEFRAAAFGMFVVSGTEETEAILAKTGVMSGFANQLGFTPQYLPTAGMQEASVISKQGVVVR